MTVNQAYVLLLALLLKLFWRKLVGIKDLNRSELLHFLYSYAAWALIFQIEE